MTVKKGASGAIRRNCRDLFNEEAETLVPRLMREKGAPHRVAAVIDVTPTAVREWLLNRGWVYDGLDWVEPTAEQSHA